MPLLEAGPVRLRGLVAGDRALYSRLYGDADTMAWIGAVPDADARSRSFWAARRMNDQFPRRGGYWVVCGAAADAPLGLAGLILDEHLGGEVGVVLPAAHQGCSYATHAIAAMVEYAFGAMGRMRLHTRHDAGHAAAVALMQTLGFECIGAEPGEKGWRWQLTPARWATSPRRQDGRLGVRSLDTPGRGQQPR
jgi:RimJ/RimL family protein N-acetyltransferase